MGLYEGTLGVIRHTKKGNIPYTEEGRYAFRYWFTHKYQADVYAANVLASKAYGLGEVWLENIKEPVELIRNEYTVRVDSDPAQMRLNDISGRNRNHPYDHDYRYFTIDLYGTHTTIKTELTSQVQSVYEYYFGSNPDGSGSDRFADHHIAVRIVNPDTLGKLLQELNERGANLIARPVDPDDGDELGGLSYRARFFRDYPEPFAKPKPYTYSA